MPASRPAERIMPDATSRGRPPLHDDEGRRTAGVPLAGAAGAVVALHGRGATADSILALAEAFDVDGVAYVAPQAAARTWYPRSFLAPLEANEPYLSSALGAVARTLAAVEAAGLPAGRVVLLGFSQGACLAAEFAARAPRPYGGVVALSGGLIGNVQGAGPPPGDKGFDYDGGLEGVPVFLGCSDRDPHIPQARVEQTEEVFTRLGADVDKRIYPGMGHTVIPDEVDAVRRLLERMLAA